MIEKILNRQENSLYVGMGDLVMGSSPDVFICLGLGSCIALVIYSPKRKLAAMAHIMLPKSPNSEKGKPFKAGKFADRAVPEMLDILEKEGVARSEVRAKLAGGARMFAFSPSPMIAIGEQNIFKVTDLLGQYSIPIEACDTGGNKGRSITFHTETCALEVRVMGERTKTL